MKDKKICWIRVIKNICYILVPFLLASLLLSIISVAYVYEMGIVKEEKNYYETTQFAEEYFEHVKSNISSIERENMNSIERCRASK